MASALGACENNYVSVLRPLWADYVAPTQSEMQAARDEIARCLNAAGVKAPPHPSGVELMKLAYPDGPGRSSQPDQLYRGCASSVASKFDLPGYIGQ